jgi:hypothetical protein
VIRYARYSELMDELVYKRPAYAGSRYMEHGWDALPQDVRLAVIKNIRTALLELDMGHEPAVPPPPPKPDVPITQPEGGAW